MSALEMVSLGKLDNFLFFAVPPSERQLPDEHLNWDWPINNSKAKH